MSRGTSSTPGIFTGQALLLAAALSLALAGCDASIEGSKTGGGDDGGGGGQDGLALPDGFTGACTPPCTSPQFCSKAGTCLDPGKCSDHADCPSNQVCDPFTHKCVAQDKCGSMQLSADAVPPNMLLDLDRSCSMKKQVAAVGKSKWEIAVAALNKVLADNKGKIRFGLTLFPDISGNSCKQGTPEVSVAAGTETKISNVLTKALQKADKNYPDGPCVTNIDTAMQQAQQHQPLYDSARENFVVLITDGKQAGCSVAGGDKGTEKIIKALASKQIKTFVVGFGDGVDPKQLDIFAVAGGAPAAGATKFYKAEDQKSLDKALAAIASSALGCVFKLTKVPPSMDKVYVFFDKQSVSKDSTHADGWDYDAAGNTVTFYGPACAKLKGGQVKDLEFVYGCKKPATCPAGAQPCTMPEDCPISQSCKSGCCAEVLK